VFHVEIVFSAFHHDVDDVSIVQVKLFGDVCRDVDSAALVECDVSLACCAQYALHSLVRSVKLIIVFAKRLMDRDREFARFLCADAIVVEDFSD
jgi:hypothetical protein